MNEPLYIFDIDGTLLDSAQSYVEVLVKAFRRMGLQEIDTDFDNYLHHTDSYALQYNFEKNFDRPFKEDLYQELDQYLGEEIQRQAPPEPIPGAAQFIDDLKTRSIPFAYATGAFPQPTHYKMREAGVWLSEALLATSINHITRETMVQEAITRARRFFNVKEEKRVISVGDGLWDLQTAQNIGVEFVGIGLKNRQTLLDHGCQHWFENIEEMQNNFN